MKVRFVKKKPGRKVIGTVRVRKKQAPKKTKGSRYA